MTAPSPFAPTPLFAFPLFSTILNGYDAHKEPLLAAILEHRQKNPGIQRSNRNAWHSGDHFMQVASPDVGWVMEKVVKFARLALAPYYGEWQSQELRLGSYWANVLDTHGWNAPHHHYPQHWSGAFYVSVGQVGTSADDLSGLIEFINPSPIHSLIGRGGNFVYGPKDGMALLFPAALVHYVHPYRGEGQRVSLAYNFNVHPKKAGAMPAPAS